MVIHRPLWIKSYTILKKLWITQINLRITRKSFVEILTYNPFT